MSNYYKKPSNYYIGVKCLIFYAKLWASRLNKFFVWILNGFVWKERCVIYPIKSMEARDEKHKPQYSSGIDDVDWLQTVCGRRQHR